MRRARTIVLASGNAAKLREIRLALGELPVKIESPDTFGEIAEPLEDGVDFAANARIKALHYARATGAWALADDSGLEVDLLGGAPGLRSARYAQDDLPAGAGRSERDHANTARLLRELDGAPPEKRSARFVCHLTLADPDRVLLETCDTVEGIITDQAKGTNGFGYDPVFFIPELGRTVAQLTPDEKNRISHRGKAVRRMAELLEGFLASRQ
ncbi:MAG: RdgB/HAM1 family non-canonical purine NTP pyrophosphatase [Planctomycetes bacterium]|nr:RdgB/HAM1 family non-canonical purine NTP pyrophosphatase [Planctomycetota bacterium]